MPGLRLFKTGSYANTFANEPVGNGTINLGSTRGKGSSTRMFSWCHQHSPEPSECINQFINVNSNSNSNSSSTPISLYQDLNIDSILINDTPRYYVVLNKNNLSVNNKVLLCFPAGGSDISEFFETTQFNNISNCLIVFLGQKSYNSYTFQNAFPWLYRINNNHDVLFVDSVLELLFNNNIPNLFLTGKSNGAGFTMLYSNLSKYTSYIKGIGVCAGSYFGLNSPDNIGVYSSKNRYRNSEGMIVPYNIILPKINIPVFIFHGTGDTVTPYIGSKFENAKAYSKPSLWQTIDKLVNPNSSVITTNTYTVNIPNYVSKIIYNNSLSLSYTDSNPNYTWSSYNNANGNVLNLITINDQGPVWSGPSIITSPDSFLPSNLYLDATYLFIKFFNLEQGNYKETVNVIPPNLLTHNNNIIV